MCCIVAHICLQTGWVATKSSRTYIKNKTKCSLFRDIEVIQMKKMFELVRSYSVQTPWETEP